MTKLDESKRAAVRPSDLLAAAAALAAGTQAYAEVIIFINPDEGEPGHFDWAYSGGSGLWLDVTLPSTDQGGLIGPSSVGQSLVEVCYPHFGCMWYNRSWGGAEVAYAYASAFTLALSAGAPVSNMLGFDSSVWHARAGYGPYGQVPHSEFSPGTPGYMGVRFSDVDGYHYGWIGVVRGGWQDLDLDAFAWGYETEPGVPIIAGIPAPGTLAALAFGAVVTRRGRKRKGD